MSAPTTRMGGAILLAICLGSSNPKPTSFPRELRPVVRFSMNNHGGDLLQLMAAVTLLQYDQVEEAAQRISSEPRLARPAGEEANAANAAIPLHFFELQDALRLKADALAAAARRHNDARLGEALGEMMQSCVACHSLYLPRKSPSAAPTPPKR